MEEEPDWIAQAKEEESASIEPAHTEPELVSTASDTEAWLRSLDEADAVPEPVSTSNDDTEAWLKSLDEPELETPAQLERSEDLPAWMQNIEQENITEVELIVPQSEAIETSDLESSVEEPVAQTVAPVEEAPEEEDISGWLSGLDKEEEQAAMPVASNDDLPAWLRDDTGELVAEPPKIEPTRPRNGTLWMKNRNHRFNRLLLRPSLIPSKSRSQNPSLFMMSLNPLQRQNRKNLPRKRQKLNQRLRLNHIRNL